jgi:ABC-type multidrug transport system ATPase subunit
VHVAEPFWSVEAKGLAKDYGDLVALAPIDLKVAEGEMVVLVGPNGSGKTTLLRMIAGLLEPSGGELLINGDPVGSIDARAATSYLPDNPVLYDDLSLNEHLEYVSRLHEAADWHERAEGLLERLNLSHRADDLPARFSRGLRQKSAIALGLIRPFSLLLVDEPFVGLDQHGKEAFLELVDEASEAGATLMIATHQLDFVKRASRCIGLRDGELTYDGPAGDADVDALVG